MLMPRDPGQLSSRHNAHAYVILLNSSLHVGTPATPIITKRVTVLQNTMKAIKKDDTHIYIGVYCLSCSILLLVVIVTSYHNYL